MSTRQIKLKQLRRLKFRNIFLNTVCILLALAGISWTVNYFWKYARYEITNDAVVDQYIAPLNIRYRAISKKYVLRTSVCSCRRHVTDTGRPGIPDPAERRRKRP